jgi:hypothetical protein
MPTICPQGRELIPSTLQTLCLTSGLARNNSGALTTDADAGICTLSFLANGTEVGVTGTGVGDTGTGVGADPGF